MKENNSKKLAILLAAMLSLSLAACGDKGGDTDTTDDTVTTSAAAEESEEDIETSEADEESEAESEPDEEEEVKELPPEETPTDEETKSPVLKEIGKIGADDINFYGDTLLYKFIDDENVECLDYKGKEIDGGKVLMVSRLGDTGLFEFNKDNGDDLTHSGLMDAEGNIILGADQGVGMFSEIDSRFLKAYCPESKTTNEDEAIYYATENQFSISPGENDIFYKGTVKVYDTKENKFLENTAQNFDPHYSVNGDIISFYDDDSNVVYVSADDKVLDIGNKSIIGEKFFMERQDDRHVIYDHDFNELFKTDHSVYDLDSTAYYYKIDDYESNKKGVMSAMGRTIIEPKYDDIYGVTENYFEYSNSDLRGLLKADGTEITGENYQYINYVGPGYFKGTTETGDELFDATGKIVYREENEDDMLFTLDEAPYAKIGDDYCYLVYSKGDMSLKLPSSGSYFGDFILYSYNNKALYDIVTGEVLLDGFDKAYRAYDCIYTLKGKEITVYSIN